MTVRDGHSQSLVPDADKDVELITAAHIAGPLGLLPQLLLELVEGPGGSLRWRRGGRRAQSAPTVKRGGVERQLFVIVTVTPIHQVVHAPGGSR